MTILAIIAGLLLAAWLNERQQDRAMKDAQAKRVEGMQKALEVLAEQEAKSMAKRMKLAKALFPYRFGEKSE